MLSERPVLILFKVIFSAGYYFFKKILLFKKDFILERKQVQVREEQKEREKILSGLSVECKPNASS